MKTEHMQTNTETLTDLYRRLGEVDLPSGLDAEALVAYAAGELSADAARQVEVAITTSPRLVQLLALLRDLAPASADLAQAVQAQTVAGGHRRHAHAAPEHRVRATRTHRPARWLSVAAVLLVALGMWGWQRVDVPHTSTTAEVPTATQQAPDSIFDSGMDHRLAAGQPPNSDQIFRTDFKEKRS